MARTHSFNSHIQHIDVHIELEQNPGQALDQPQHSLEDKKRPWKWEVYDAHGQKQAATPKIAWIIHIFEHKA